MAKLYVHSLFDKPDKNKAVFTPKPLQQNLIDSYDKQLFVDAEVIVQQRIFKAHKCILAFYSPLFWKAFYGAKLPTSICVINDVNPDGFDILLRFLYSSKTPVGAHSNNVVDAYFAAQYLEMTYVKMKLIDYIFYHTESRIWPKPLAEEKFWFLLETSHSLKIKDLEEKLLKFAEKNIASILYHKDFPVVSSEVVKLVLSLKTLAMPDKTKLERIAYWRDSNSNLDILEPSVRDLLTCINFERLTAREFYFIASEHENLISGKDAFDILMHLVDPIVSPLPYWCSVNDRRMNIPADPTLNEVTANLEHGSKSDKVKSLQNLDKIGNLESISDRKMFVSHSQIDFGTLDCSKPLESWSEINTEALQNLDKISNHESISDRKMFVSHSQIDFGTLDYSKPLEDWSEINTNTEEPVQRKEFSSKMPNLSSRIGASIILHSSDFRSEICSKVYSKTLPESFSQMLEEGVLTDVTLCAKDGTKIPAHRLILALGSEIFANMLYGTAPMEIIRLDESVDDLKCMLKYFYGIGEMLSLKTSQDRFDSVLRLQELAQKYECHPLRQTCWDLFHSTQVTPSVFWKFLNQANQLKLLKVNTELLMTYAQTSPRKVFDHISFYSATKNSLIRILESDYLNISECDILEYLARWLEANSNDFPSDHSRKDLFKYIRFKAINAEQFFSFLKQHDELLNKDDAFTLLEFLFRDSNEKDLPKWCYQGPLRSFFYCASTKIGTDVLIPWKTTAEKGKNRFRCTYTVTSSNKFEESSVQYLELSWKLKPNKKGTYINHKCSITIKHDDYDPLTFTDVDVTKNPRIIVPVFFVLINQKPKTQFDIEVKAQGSYRYYFIKGQKRMTFQNVIIESTTDMNCLSDAIVDNCTSEDVQIPKYLLPPKSHVAITTENSFKVISEDTD